MGAFYKTSAHAVLLNNLNFSSTTPAEETALQVISPSLFMAL